MELVTPVSVYKLECLLWKGPMTFLFSKVKVQRQLFVHSRPKEELIWDLIISKHYEQSKSFVIKWVWELNNPASEQQQKSNKRNLNFGLKEVLHYCTHAALWLIGPGRLLCRRYL